MDSTFSAAEVKAAARGRWQEIIVSLTGIDAELLDGHGHPCPRCGGHDRFSMIDPDAGALFCRHCFDTKNGDGIAAVGWLLDLDFLASLRLVAEHLGLGARNGKCNGQARPPKSKGKVNKTYATVDDALADLERRYGPPSSVYRYHDADGALALLVVRWDIGDGRKEIRPVSRRGEEWVIGGMVAPSPLYHLLDLADAQQVYVCEGEPAADAARSIGLTATTSAGGSCAAGKTDWTPLAGRNVIILPDCDAPGEKYAADVAGILLSLDPPAKVKTCRLPGLPPAGDMVDWVAAHGDACEPSEYRRQIAELVEAAPVETPESDMVEPIEPPASYVPFPIEALPYPLCAFVGDGAKAIGCDASYVALPMLCVLAAAIGDTRRIGLKRGWSAPAIIWAAVVGESGMSKTPSLRLALQPIRDRQGKALERHAEAMRQYDSDLAQHEKDYAAWKRDKTSIDDAPEKPVEPQAVRSVVSDTTVEALAPILLANPRGLLMARDELSGWIGSFDRYSGGKGGGDSASWLSMFNAESMMVDRRTGKPPTLYVPRAAVSVCGTIQPGVLARSLGAAHRESGLAARLLLSCPTRKAKRWSEAEIDPRLEAEYARLVERLHELQPMVGDDGELRPVVVGLTTDAKATFVTYYDTHNREQAELTGDLSAAWSKLEEYAARLALVVHFARWAAGDESLDVDAVDAASIEAAIKLVAWFKAEARRVYALLGESDDDRDQRRLVEWIAQRGGAATAREVQQGCRWLRESGEAEAALEELAKAKMGRWETVSTTAKGGKPTRVFRLSTVSTSTIPTENPRETEVT